MAGGRTTSCDPGGTLTILGCDGSYPGPGGAASGYVVEADGVALWLDAGPGTFAALQLISSPARIDAVVLTHEHPDHWTDVESFCVWLRQHRSPPVPVYAPRGLRARSYFAEDPVLAWHELDPATILDLRARTASGAGRGGVRLTFAQTDHGPPTAAVRIDRVDLNGGIGAAADALAYSADTGPGWSVETLGAGIGTFLCEATYGQDLEGEGRHLSGRQAGAMARQAQVSRLVLTHRRPSVPAEVVVAEADEAFGRPVHQATAGRVIAW